MNEEIGMLALDKQRKQIVLITSFDHSSILVSQPLKHHISILQEGRESS